MKDRDNKQNNEKHIPLYKILLVTFGSYFPAFVLVLLSFFLFKSANKLSQETQIKELAIKEVSQQLDKKISEKEAALKALSRTKANQTNQPVTVEQVRKEVTGQLRKELAVLKVDNSVLARGYIDGQIEQKAQAQAEKAAKDEIDMFKADWKGDLFSQISFPVIFAIASIFAAFAVKDILVAILKQDERKKLKDELILEFKNQVSPKIIKNVIDKHTSIPRRLKKVEAYASWLEHKLLNIEILQMIEEEGNTGLDDSRQREYIVSAIDKTLDRLAITMDGFGFISDDIKQLKLAEQEVLKSRIKRLNLGDESDKIFGKIDKNTKAINAPPLESLLELTEDIYKMEMRLLIATLSKLGEYELIDKLKKYLNDRSEGFKQNLQYFEDLDSEMEANNAKK